jgi:hypothetical protein
MKRRDDRTTHSAIAQYVFPNIHPFWYKLRERIDTQSLKWKDLWKFQVKFGRIKNLTMEEMRVTLNNER